MVGIVVGECDGEGSTVGVGVCGVCPQLTESEPHAKFDDGEHPGHVPHV